MMTRTDPVADYVATIAENGDDPQRTTWRAWMTGHPTNHTSARCETGPAVRYEDADLGGELRYALLLGGEAFKDAAAIIVTDHGRGSEPRAYYVACWRHAKPGEVNPWSGELLPYPGIDPVTILAPMRWTATDNHQAGRVWFVDIAA